MAKSINKIDLSDPKGGELFYMGISSATGIAVLCNQVNKYLGIQLSFYSNLMAMNQDTILDNLPIFTSFEPKVNALELNNKTEDDDFFDLGILSKTEVSKYLLIQCKGERSILFPKITQLDYLFISNYSVENLIPTIQQLPEVTIAFPLQSMHIGKRYDYFRKLFYTN
ncbi:MAG: hypothetical protein JNL75_05170 [Chitinophagales bacterium]|nr:hypothetical protein [Chitinophagales bacterium]